MPDSTLVVGVAAATLALFGTPLLAVLGVLHFVLGGVLALVAPLAAGLVAVVAGVRVFRRRELAGAALLAGSVLATAVGLGFGVTTVY